MRILYKSNDSAGVVLGVLEITNAETGPFTYEMQGKNYICPVNCLYVEESNTSRENNVIIFYSDFRDQATLAVRELYEKGYTDLSKFDSVFYPDDNEPGDMEFFDKHCKMETGVNPLMPCLE